MLIKLGHAPIITNLQIDVLVELTGHTANNRLGTMAACPSPVQVTWIGYPNSTGLEAVQYRITDSICDPLDTTQRFTGWFWCFLGEVCLQ